jgi:5'-nucleotidase/UDP-sugar diphosphatase
MSRIKPIKSSCIPTITTVISGAMITVNMVSAQKTLVDGIRKEVAAEGGSVLLLSGGDINTGVPESDLQDAEPDFRGMNLIGYDAMAVGNQFDNPLSVLRQQEKWAKFPFLSANIYQSTGERLFKPWALLNAGD